MKEPESLMKYPNEKVMKYPNENSMKWEWKNQRIQWNILMKILWNGNESARGPNEISQWKFYEMVMKAQVYTLWETPVIKWMKWIGNPNEISLIKTHGKLHIASRTVVID